MKINSLKIQNFRNISNLDLTFDNINIIWGENAQGKTNLIEAIYLFTGSKSFRGAKDSQLVKFDSEFSKLSLDFESNNRPQNAEILIKAKREATLNGIKRKTPNELGDEIKSVIFSPVDLNMVKFGPEYRRKFVDNSLCQIKGGYRQLLKNYNRALFQRNTLLNRNEKYKNVKYTLPIWDENIISLGAKVIYQRLKYIDSAIPFIKEIYGGISGKTEEVDLKYVGYADYECDLEQIKNKLREGFEKNKENDISNKTTTVGPHRDDIEILIDSVSTRIYASQGQQRSCVLSLKLAQAQLLKQMTNIEPIALLDDVMSELDEKRQDYILNQLENWQVFITCCDKNTITRLREGKTFQIKNGECV